VLKQKHTKTIAIVWFFIIVASFSTRLVNGGSFISNKKDKIYFLS